MLVVFLELFCEHHVRGFPTPLMYILVILHFLLVHSSHRCAIQGYMLCSPGLRSFVRARVCTESTASVTCSGCTPHHTWLDVAAPGTCAHTSSCRECRSSSRGAVCTVVSPAALVRSTDVSMNARGERFSYLRRASVTCCIERTLSSVCHPARSLASSNTEVFMGGLFLLSEVISFSPHYRWKGPVSCPFSPLWLSMR